MAATITQNSCLTTAAGFTKTAGDCNGSLQFYDCRFTNGSVVEMLLVGCGVNDKEPHKGKQPIFVQPAGVKMRYWWGPRDGPRQAKYSDLSQWLPGLWHEQVTFDFWPEREAPRDAVRNARAARIGNLFNKVETLANAAVTKVDPNTVIQRFPRMASAAYKLTCSDLTFLNSDDEEDHEECDTEDDDENLAADEKEEDEDEDESYQPRVKRQKLSSFRKDKSAATHIQAKDNRALTLSLSQPHETTLHLNSTPQPHSAALTQVSMNRSFNNGFTIPAPKRLSQTTGSATQIGTHPVSSAASPSVTSNQRKSNAPIAHPVPRTIRLNTSSGFAVPTPPKSNTPTSKSTLPRSTSQPSTMTSEIPEPARSYPQPDVARSTPQASVTTSATRVPARGTPQPALARSTPQASVNTAASATLARSTPQPALTTVASTAAARSIRPLTPASSDATSAPPTRKIRANTVQATPAQLTPTAAFNIWHTGRDGSIAPEQLHEAISTIMTVAPPLSLVRRAVFACVSGQVGNVYHFTGYLDWMQKSGARLCEDADADAEEAEDEDEEVDEENCGGEEDEDEDVVVVKQDDEEYE